MILVFVTNSCIGEVKDLPLEGRVSYHNPKCFKASDHPLPCDKVYIHGDFPEVGQCYKDKLITFDSDSSKNYTIAELREMKSDIEDWDSFIKGDTRKSVTQI